MEALFPDLFDAVPDALIVVDRDGRIVMANRQAEHLFGYPAQALAGVEIEILLPEEARGRHRAYRADYMAKPRVRPMGAAGQTLVGLRADGTRFPVEIALSPIDSDRTPRYLASVRDISETQRSRQALVRAGYDALVARIGQMALEADDEADVLEQVSALLVDVLEIDAIAIARLQPGGQSMEKLVSVGLIAYARQPRRFDHDAVHLLQSIANLLAALAQRRHTEEQLAHAQRLDALGQLTGGIAHDFNNLLTVMSGSLQLLEQETQERPEARELIATALRSVARGAELTSKLRAFARKQRLLPQATDTQLLLQDVRLMLRRTLGETVSLHVDAEAGLPAAFVDPAQLETALVNLALNARDAMPGGGRIDIRARHVLVDADHSREGLPIGYYILITVSDTGHGMSPEILARAMEPFFTTKESGRGSGLGLSMVYGFAKQSGGHLQIDSAPGQGTRIGLYLPATRAAAGIVEPVADGRTGHGGETILVVEDEPAVRGICVAFLRSSAYKVLAVANAEDAMKVFAETPEIALVFSDVMLGSGRNGKELAAHVRQLKPGFPVLLTSGYEEHAAADGAEFELLRKPYRREQLLAAVQRLLGTGR